MSKTLDGGDHHITIPIHSPIKIGTLSSILKEISEKQKLTKEELLQRLC